MTDDDRAIRALRDQLDRLAVSDAARARLDARFDDVVVAATATPSAPPRTRRRRAPRVAVGAVLAGAALIALAVALAPSGSKDGAADQRGFVGPDTAAARELVRAGEAAADAAWKPLGPGDTFHTYSTTFDPGGGVEIATLGGSTDTFEVWIDRDGRGQALNVMGSGNPDRVPFAYRDRRTGKIQGVGPTRPAPGQKVTTEESLTTPDGVNLMVWGPDAFQRSWVRTKDGYELTHDSRRGSDPGSIPPSKVDTRQYWGVTMAQVDALPTTAGPELDAAVERLLDAYLADSAHRSNRIPTGAFGVTAKQADREEKIQYAVRLLGAAPLAPNARRSLFRWLARQPGATIEADAHDQLGRPGVRISFASSYDERVPARTVTAAQLLDEARAAGARGLDGDVRLTTLDLPKTNEEMVRRQHEDFNVDIPATRAFPVKAHRELRTWLISFVIDPDTGDLFQSVMEAKQTVEGASLPQLHRMPNGDVQVNDSGQSEVAAGANLYIARDRAPISEPESPVCGPHPELCRP